MLLVALALADEPVPCQEGVEGCQAPPRVLGSLEKSVIDGVIKANMRAVRRCYQDGLSQDPMLAGAVRVKFVIAKDGTVSSAVTRQTTLGAPGVESCLNRQFMTLVFPPPQGGGSVIVTYPFIFTPYDLPSGRAVVSGPRLRVRQVIRTLAPYRRAATACSPMTASRSVRFVVTADGAMEDLRLFGMPEPKEAEETCVRTALAPVHFSPPGSPVRVYYTP